MYQRERERETTQISDLEFPNTYVSAFIFYLLRQGALAIDANMRI